MSATAIHLLLLIIVANSMPVLMTRLLGARYSWPVDAHRSWRDQRRLLGPSKTWRGIFSAVIVTSLAAPLLGHSWWLGALTAALAMLGDLFSSFCKRRLGRASSARATGLDQLPEALLPALLLKPLLALEWLEVLLIPLLFMLLEMVFSVLLFRLGIRKQPY